MVRLTVVIRVPLRKTRGVVEALRSLMMSTRLQPGCLGCCEWVDPDSVVHYEEEWATEPDIRRRVQSDAFTTLLAVLESTSEPPRIKLEFVARTRGVDYVEEARGVVS